jgi:hypothetical protein
MLPVYKFWRPVYRVRQLSWSFLEVASVADPGWFIPDPDPTIAPSRIRIPDPDPGSVGVKKHRIPDPTVHKNRDEK